MSLDRYKQANTHSRVVSIFASLVFVYARRKKNAFEIFMLILYSCITKVKFLEIPKVEITIKLMPNTMHASAPIRNRYKYFALFGGDGDGGGVYATWKISLCKSQSIRSLVNCHRFSKSLAPRAEKWW